MLLVITIASAVGFVLIAFVVPFIRLLIRQALSPLRHLPSPPCTSFFMGNLPEMHDQENNNIILRWVASYGQTFSYRGFIGGRRLMTIDPLAIAHILSHAYQYPKPDFVRDSLASMAGAHEGILTVEGEDHRRQRKILSPAFSLSHINSLTPIFWDKATTLRDIWLDHADAIGPHLPQSARVDVLSGLARATLDVIGEAGFGYRFNSLLSTPSSKSNELAEAFSIIFSTARKFRVITILQAWFPVLRRFRHNNSVMKKAKATMHRIGLQLIAQKRAEIQDEQAGINDDKPARSRDLLSLLIRSNLTVHQPETIGGEGRTTPRLVHDVKTGYMSTQEILSQISTFISAGHETTASALTWCLYALARDQRVQAELRKNLRILESEHGSDREALTRSIEACTYLDWVVRESLRLHAPVTATMRVCAKPGGDCIPLSRPLSASTSPRRRASIPEEGKAEEQSHIFLAEGDIINIPIQAVNRSTDIWGEDGSEFRPERWATTIPESVRSIQGLYAHTLTFLNGSSSSINATGGLGNRSCIGWRFALSEIKIFLYTLIKDIEFELEEGIVIEKMVNVVTRPLVKSEPALGNQMPLNIRRISR